MFPITHVISALLASKYLGHTVPILIGSSIIDLDHIYDLIKHGWKRGIIKRFFESLLIPCPEEDESRTVFHSLLGWLVVSAVFYVADPEFGIYFSLGYFIHLGLDSLDTTRLHLFYPHRYDVRGYVEYNSLMEYALGIGMFIVYFFF